MTFDDRHQRQRLGTNDAATIMSMIGKALNISPSPSAMVTSPVVIYGDEGDVYIHVEVFDFTAEVSVPANSNAEIFCAPISDEQNNHIIFGTWRVAGNTTSRYLLLHEEPGRPFIAGIRKVSGNLKGVVRNNTNQPIEVTLCYV